MKFKEINGEVFYYLDEPTEIDINTKTPLLARYYQGRSRMGSFNKDVVSKEEINEERIVDKITNGRIAMYRNSNKGDNIHRLVTVGKHCPEGSREWALWKMLNGEMVHRSGFPYKALNGEIYCTNSAGEIYPATSYQLWLENKEEYGWKIYEEPRRGTPDWAWKQMLAGKEVYRYDYDRNYRMNVCGYVISTDGDYAYNYNQFLNIEHADDWLVHEIPKVGEWYKRGYNYYQCSSVHKHEEGTHVYLRKAGDKVSRHKIYMTKSYGELVPASLTPNFKDAKIGDKCFSIIDGPSEITQLSTDSRPLPVGYLSVSGADRVCCNNGFELGRKMYPTLFHSAKQAVAYFAEVALKEENDG